MSDLTTAKIIAQQLGNKCLYMIGAKNLAGDDNSLQFKIGRNSIGITHIKIELTGMDLYNMKFYKFRKPMTEKSLEPVAEALGIYDDMLHAMIEKHTGLRTKL